MHGDELQFPQINLNGADGLDLARQYHEAALAVEEAHRKIAHLVHGRDYQTLPPEAFKLAYDQNVDRIRELVKIHSELTRIAEFCADSVGAPRGRI